MKRPVFFAKMGFWGQHGWKRIRCIQYVWGRWLADERRVVKIRWVRKRKAGA